MKYLKYILTILFVCSFAFAQKVPDKSTFYKIGVPIYTDLIILPVQNQDSIKITVLYRVLHDAIVFQLVEGNTNKYYSKVNFDISFKDNDGIIRKRLFVEDTVYAIDVEQTRSKEKYYYGMVSTILSKNKYDVLINLIDNSQNSIYKQELKAEVPQDLYTKKSIFSPIFTRKTNNQEFLININNTSIPFNSLKTDIFLVASNLDIKDNISYSIKRKIDKESEWGKKSEYSGNAEIIENSKLETYFDKSNIKLTVNTSADTNDKYKLIHISLPAEGFFPEAYILTINNNTINQKYDFNFEVRWDDKPISLKNPEYAVELLYQMVDDSTYDEIYSGSKAEMYSKLIKWWKAKDPSPETPFNEAMVEYYKRVDYAFMNYQTISEKDGAKTDRGTIHILFGLPDNIETKMENNKTIETWTYKKLNKIFKFEMIEIGIFKLIEIKE